MRLGIGSYTFTWAVGVPGHPPARPLTVTELARTAARLGVRVVQYADNLPLTRCAEPKLKELEVLADRHGLQFELGTRGIRAGRLDEHLTLARRFRAPFVRLVLDAPGHEPSRDEAVELLRPIAARYADAGVILALENHDRFPARVLAGMAEELGRDRVGVVLDTVNSFGALEGPAEVVPALAPYTVNLHVKDFTVRRVPSQMGFMVEGCPVGQGRLDVPWLLAALRAAGRDVNAVVELWTPPAATLEETLAREAGWAAESVQFLRNLIPG